MSGEDTIHLEVSPQMTIDYSIQHPGLAWAILMVTAGGGEACK